MKISKMITSAVVFCLCAANAMAQDEEFDFSSAAPASWQKGIVQKSPKSITDYYLLLPESLATGELYGAIKDSKEFRMKQLTVNDVKNGYIEAPSLQMAVFRDKEKGRDVVGVVLGCGEPPFQYCNQYFLEFDSSLGKWKKINDIFPWVEVSKMAEARNDEYYYVVLPRYGTVAEVMVAADDKPATLLTKAAWTNGKFNLVKP